MNPSTFVLLCGLLAGCGALEAQESPVLKGYVTRAASASDFDVNSVRILCLAKNGDVSKPSRDGAVPTVDCPGQAPRIGDRFAVRYTVRDTTANAIYATGIDKQQASSLGGLSGSAVIDSNPVGESAGGKLTELTLRADGYRILIDANTRIDWRAPLQSLTDVKAGDWISYKGKIGAEGVLVARSVQIGPNAVGEGEQEVRMKDEYDPSTIQADVKQNYVKDAVKVGYDPKKFPPFKDSALQSRVERIGNRLIPAYQHALPVSDSARFDFRFQVIDTKLFRDAFTLSSGIVLIPHQVVDRMENDSQVAAVLADGIARVLERQEYRTERKVKAAYISLLAMPILSYAGLGGTVASEIQKKAMEQRSRVSLCLLQDAGYDVGQAPMAWWRLAEAKPKPVADVEVPDRAAYLYQILRETWVDSEVPGRKYSSWPRLLQGCPRVSEW